jgi:putative transcriptional regulator
MTKEDAILKNRVKELRTRLDMRQADLAREVDVTRQTILAIEKSRLNPSVALSLKIARVLREPVDYVFYLEKVEGEGGGGKKRQRASRRKPSEPQSVFDF